MDKFILMWVVMTPNPDGVPGHLKHWEARGPITEHTCLMLQDEMNNLASQNSEPHALISFCRPMTDEAARMLERLAPEPEDASDTSA